MPNLKVENTVLSGIQKIKGELTGILGYSPTYSETIGYLIKEHNEPQLKLETLKKQKKVEF